LKRLYKLSIHFVFIILFALGTIFSTLADVYYPKYNESPVIDLSGRLDPHYISKLESDLANAPMEIRIVFIYSENKINLGIYAAKLYDLWEMTGDSILVVVDPVTNEVGYGISQTTKKKLKQRKETVVDNKGQQKPKEGITEDLSSVEPETLVSAIVEKFTRTEIIIGSDNTNNQKNSNGAGSTMNLIMNKVGLSGINSDNSKRTINIPVFEILIILIIFAVISLFSYLYILRLKKKKLKELKDTYSLDGNVLTQGIGENLEKISSDLERMNKYRGKTKEVLENHINKLKTSEREATEHLDKLDKNLEEMKDIDDLEETGKLMEDGDMLNKGLEALHKESLEYRKEFRAILKKGNANISDVRVNIESCKNLVDETKTLYKLELTNIIERIKDLQVEIPNLESYINNSDPIGFTEYLGTVHQKIREIRKDVDIIPHLHKQIQENIPQTMTSYLKHPYFMINIFERERIRQELIQLRSDALNVLSIGDLKASEEILTSIFKILNSEPKQPENAENAEQSSLFDTPKSE